MNCDNCSHSKVCNMKEKFVELNIAIQNLKVEYNREILSINVDCKEFDIKALSYKR